MLGSDSVPLTHTSALSQSYLLTFASVLGTSQALPASLHETGAIIVITSYILWERKHSHSGVNFSFKVKQ